MASHTWSSGDEDAVRRGNAVRRLLLRHGVLAEGDILDVGCGEGGVASAFASARRIVGLDAAHHLVGRGRQAGRDVVFVAGDATSLPLRRDSFDAVLLFDVLEHVLDWPTVITEAARVVRPGGAVFVTAANTRSPITILDDPHWHLPLIAILPSRASAALVRWLRGKKLDMAGIHPVFPGWGEIQSAFRRAGLTPIVVSNMEKVLDPEGIVDPARRRLGALLNARGVHSGPFSRVFRPVVRIYDLALARSWTFLAFKSG